MTSGMADDLRLAQKRLADSQKTLAAAKAAALAGDATTLPNGARHLITLVEGIDPKSLQVCIGPRA